MYVKFLLCLDISRVDVSVVISLWNQKDFFNTGISEPDDKTMS